MEPADACKHKYLLSSNKELSWCYILNLSFKYYASRPKEVSSADETSFASHEKVKFGDVLEYRLKGVVP